MNSSVLTRTEAAVLTAVAQQGAASQLEIPRLASLTLSEARSALGKLRERHLLEQTSSSGDADANGSMVYFTPTPSGIEAADLLRRSRGNVVSQYISDDDLPDEDELDSALQEALAALE